MFKLNFISSRKQTNMTYAQLDQKYRKSPIKNKIGWDLQKVALTLGRDRDYPGNTKQKQWAWIAFSRYGLGFGQNRTMFEIEKI